VGVIGENGRGIWFKGTARGALCVLPKSVSLLLLTIYIKKITIYIKKKTLIALRVA